MFHQNTSKSILLSQRLLSEDSLSMLRSVQNYFSLGITLLIDNVGKYCHNYIHFTKLYNYTVEPVLGDHPF